jgi:DNA-directed RNA polymerase beta' subunit
LAKRVDYSARSTLTINQQLPYGFAGIPYKILRKLYIKNIQEEMIRRGVADSRYQAFKMLRSGEISIELVDSIIDDLS